MSGIELWSEVLQWAVLLTVGEASPNPWTADGLV